MTGTVWSEGSGKSPRSSGFILFLTYFYPQDLVDLSCFWHLSTRRDLSPGSDKFNKHLSTSIDSRLASPGLIYPNLGSRFVDYGQTATFWTRFGRFRDGLSALKWNIDLLNFPFQATSRHGVPTSASFSCFLPSHPLFNVLNTCQHCLYTSPST